MPLHAQGGQHGATQPRGFLSDLSAARTPERTVTTLPPAHTGSFTSQSPAAQDSNPDLATWQAHPLPRPPADASRTMNQSQGQPTQTPGAAIEPASQLHPQGMPQHRQHVQQGPGCLPQYFTPNGGMLPGVGPRPSWSLHQQHTQQPISNQQQQQQKQQLHFQPQSVLRPQHGAPGLFGMMPDLDMHAPEAGVTAPADAGARQPRPVDSGEEDEARWEQGSPSKHKKAKLDRQNKVSDSRSSKFKGVTKHRRSGR